MLRFADLVSKLYSRISSAGFLFREAGTSFVRIRDKVGDMISVAQIGVPEGTDQPTFFDPRARLEIGKRPRCKDRVGHAY